MSRLRAEGLVNKPLNVASSSPVSGVPATSALVLDGSRAPPPCPVIRTGFDRTGRESARHATLHGLANLGIERMICRPINPPSPVEPYQSATFGLG